MTFLKKITDKVNIQAILVSLCVFGVCVATQQSQTVAWNTGIIEFARDSLGVVMAVIIFTNYKRADFTRYKLPYIIWSAVGAPAAIVAVSIAFGRRLDFLKADTVIIALGVFLMGYCIIHTIISFFVEKRRPAFYRPLFLIWMVMLALMIFSRSDYIWPECYFVLFLCYYLTPQTPEQRENVAMGLVNGLILGFVLIQTHSLLFRPYDRLRYVGNFCNPNNNCLFLCFCLAAILAKILWLTEKKGRKVVRIVYFLMAGACYSFICMTMGRSGYLTAVILTIFFLAAYCKIEGRKVFMRMGALLIAVFTAMLPVTYLAVRYIPTIHPHVLFYYQEGYSESRVHSWDSRDSEKYITFRQMLGGIFGRFGVLVNAHDDQHGRSGGSEVLPGDMKVASAAGNIPFALLADSGTIISDTQADRRKTPALTGEEANNQLLVRFTIYKWFFEHLTLRGMPLGEQGLQLTEGYWVQHAHNIYLDYGINFGYPVMILFIIFVWWGIGRLSGQGIGKKDLKKTGSLLIALVPLCFGLFEYAWGAGMISTVALYMAFREMVIV